jgi:hypothetical protein
MPNKRLTTPAYDRLEQDFLDALARLERGEPQNPELADKARRSQLKINVLAVAQEAGHSRTSLYKYPRVLVKLEQINSPASVVKTAADLIANLRQENALLRAENKMVLTQMAAMLRRMRAMEKETNRKVRKAERQAKRNQNSNQIVGVRDDSPSEVIELKPRS